MLSWASPVQATTTDCPALLRTAQHVIDQWSVDIGTSHANRVEECFVVSDKVASVRQFLDGDLIITGVTQHHEPTCDGHRLPACASSHVYTDPFCRAIQKSSGSKSTPQTAHSKIDCPSGSLISVRSIRPRQT
jgi:hypothetical protein